MDKKHEMTEKLKALETEVYNAKVDLQAINRKIEAASDYETELIERRNKCKAQTEALRIEFYMKASHIRKLYDDMKKVMNVFTANFYKN